MASPTQVTASRPAGQPAIHCHAPSYYLYVIHPSTHHPTHHLLGRQALREGLKVARANPYLVLFEDGFPQQQTTSWEAKGQQNAP